MHFCIAPQSRCCLTAHERHKLREDREDREDDEDDEDHVDHEHHEHEDLAKSPMRFHALPDPRALERGWERLLRQPVPRLSILLLSVLPRL